MSDNTHEILIEIPFGKPVEAAGVQVRGRRLPLSNPQTLEGGSKAWIKFVADANGLVYDSAIDRVIPPDFDGWLLFRRREREWRNRPVMTKAERRAAGAPARAARKAEADRAQRLGAAMSVPSFYERPMATRLRPGTSRLEG